MKVPSLRHIPSQTWDLRVLGLSLFFYMPFKTMGVDFVWIVVPCCSLYFLAGLWMLLFTPCVHLTLCPCF